MHVATRSPGDALALALSTQTSRHTAAPDWPELLARALTCDPKISLGGWADDHALAPATVSRGFRQVYGISPNAFRMQARARLAWRRVLQGNVALASIAAETGFADQAHMTRTVQAITERTPGAWRNRVK